MIKINFNLSSKKGNKDPVPIVAMMRYSGNTIKMSTGQQLAPIYWNEKKQKAKGQGAATINHILSKLELSVRKVYNELILDGVPEKSKLRDAVIYEFKGEGKKESSMTFSEYIDGYIEIKEKILAYNTIKTYTSARNLHQEFSQLKKKNYCFKNMNVRFAREFEQFILNRGCAPNYSKRMVSTIRKLLKEAHKNGITSETHYESEFFRGEMSNPTKEFVYLNEKELQSLYELDLSGNKKLDNVRDLFLIGCYTGLRVSDYKRLLKENIYVMDNGKRAFRVRAQKTKGDVRIPIRPIIEAILEKRGGKLPRKYSEQEINRSLKQLGELAGINGDITQTSYPKGISTMTVHPKYELLSSHTARRSFATNAILEGVPYHWIMKITGHKSVKSFEKYVRMDGEEAALLLSDHRFFMKPVMKIAK